MKKTELDKSQLGHLNLYNLILEAHGWEDTLEIEKRLDQGESISPEGIRTYWHGQTRLEAQFHAPVYMISLSIADKSYPKQLHLFFFYDEDPLKILEWIAEVKDGLTPQTCASLLKYFKENFQQEGDTMLITDSPSKVYELAPTNSR